MQEFAGLLGSSAAERAGGAAVAADADRIARVMLEVYRDVLSSFPVIQQRHYQFTLRHLTAWVCGLAR